MNSPTSGDNKYGLNAIVETKIAIPDLVKMELAIMNHHCKPPGSVRTPSFQAHWFSRVPMGKRTGKRSVAASQADESPECSDGEGDGDDDGEEVKLQTELQKRAMRCERANKANDTQRSNKQKVIDADMKRQANFFRRFLERGRKGKAPVPLAASGVSIGDQSASGASGASSSATVAGATCSQSLQGAMGTSTGTAAETTRRSNPHPGS